MAGMGQWILLQIILLILYTPWASIFIEQTQRHQSGFWLDQPTLSSIVNSFSAFSGSRFSFVCFSTLLFFIIALRVRDRRDLKKWWCAIKSCLQNHQLSGLNSVLLLLVWLLTPVLLPFVLSQISTPMYLTRGMIGASPAFYLLIAKGVDSTDGWKAMKLVMIGFIVLLSAGNVWKYHTKIKKEQWREVAYHVDTQAGRGALVLFYPPFCQRAFNFYSHRLDLVKESLQEKTSEIDEMYGKRLETLMKNQQTVWAILCDKREDREKVVKTLEEGYDVIWHQHYVGIELVQFK